MASLVGNYPGFRMVCMYIFGMMVVWDIVGRGMLMLFERLTWKEGIWNYPGRISFVKWEYYFARQ